MSAQLPLGPWAPPDAEAQPAREPKAKRERAPRRTRQEQALVDDRQEARTRRPPTREELEARGRREHEAMIRARYTRLGVEPPRDEADRARADAQLAAVEAARKERAETEGGTWFYGTFMTWAQWAAEFERREGRKPGEPLTPQQRRELTWRGKR